MKLYRILNIITFLVLYSIVVIYNYSLFRIGHSEFWPYASEISRFTFANARIPALILDRCYHVIFPQLFKTTALDFQSNILIDAFLAVFYVLIVFFFLKVFYIFSQKENLSFINIITKKETSLLFLFSFFMLSFIGVPFEGFPFDLRSVFMLGSYESTVFLEYQASYILLFPLLTGILCFIFNKNYDVKMKHLIIFSIVSFLLGAWAEIVNLHLFIFFFLLVITLFLFDKNLLKQKFLNTIFISFILGTIFFYCGTDQFSSGNISTLGEYSILDKFKENMSLLNDFTIFFWETYIKQYVFYYLFMFLNSIFILFFIPKEIAKKEKILVVVISFLFLFSILALLFSSILISNYRAGCVFYCDRIYLVEMVFNYICFIILFQFGYIYNSIKVNLKKIILVLMTFFVFYSSYSFFQFYPLFVKDNLQTKVQLLQLEKKSIIFSLFGESIKLYSSLKNNFFVSNNEVYITHHTNFIHKDLKYFIAPYFEGFYEIYANNNFKKPLKAIEFVDDEILDIEYKKRLDLLEKFFRIKNPDYKIPQSIKEIKKLEDFSFQENDISILKTFIADDVIVYKLLATIYENIDINKSISFLNKFSELYPNDIDTLYSLFLLYKKSENIDLQLNMLQRIINLDNKNFIFYYELMNIKFLQKDYLSAFEICETIINLKKDEFDLNIQKDILNIAILYKYMRQKDLALSKIQEADNSFVSNFYSENKFSSFDDFYFSNKDISLYYWTVWD